MSPDPDDGALCGRLESALGRPDRIRGAGSRLASALRAVLDRHADLSRREQALARRIVEENERAGRLADARSALAACPAEADDAQVEELAARLERRLVRRSAA